MSNRNLVFAGAGLLAVGLFTPVVTMPFVGSVNLFANGTSVPALVLLALAALAGGLALKDREALAIWPGVAAGAVLAFIFIRLQGALAEMRAGVSEQLAGNPFSGFAQGALGMIQLQWGWLVLAAGAGLLVYAGLKARSGGEDPAPWLPDNTARLVAGASLALFAAAVAKDLLTGEPGDETTLASEDAGSDSATNAMLGDAVEASGPSADEARYIRESLTLYDLDARYFDGILDGRVPGVRFKIRNDGDRTLDRVTVRVLFEDDEGKAIAEEEYTPVLVSEYSFGDSNTPLRPNYIWQQDSDQFYAAKSVPSEWKTGAATARIVDIEFGPNE